MSSRYELRDFETQVLARSREVPVLVDFWAPWCGPCKMLGPVIEKLADGAGGRWELVKINTEVHQQIAGRFDVSSIPSVKLFKNGAVVDEFVGFRSEKDIAEWLAPHLGDGGGAEAEADPLERAAEHIDEGRLTEARALIEEVLRENPDRAGAKLLLAEILLGDDPARAAELADGIPVGADERSHGQALKIIALAAGRSPDTLPADPLRARLVAGLAALRRRDWDDALEQLVEVVERRPKYADGVAAEAGKAVFRYLGIRHPVADKHYRRFSGALNS